MFGRGGTSLCVKLALNDSRFGEVLIVEIIK